MYVPGRYINSSVNWVGHSFRAIYFNPDSIQGWRRSEGLFPSWYLPEKGAIKCQGCEPHSRHEDEGYSYKDVKRLIMFSFIFIFIYFFFFFAQKYWYLGIQSFSTFYSIKPFLLKPRFERFCKNGASLNRILIYQPLAMPCVNISSSVFSPDIEYS